MRKTLTIIFFIILFGKILVQTSFSQAVDLKADSQTQVQAQVGQLYLNVSGFISPFASIVMNSNGVFLRSTVADSNGYFYISTVLINRGFSGFCLTAVDFQRLGESTTCFSFPPAENNVTIESIFLPPTLGLSRTQVVAGSTVYAYGYTMPGSRVTLYFNSGQKLTIVDQTFAQANPTGGGQKLTAVADSKGYYKFSLKNLEAGSYEIYAKANYENRESETPTKDIELKVLSTLEQSLTGFWEFFKKPLESLAGLGLLWLTIPIIILIIILILKLRPRNSRRQS